MTARSLRLPDALAAEADAFAASLGISFNALATVALYDYLNARSVPKPPKAPATPSQAAKSPTPQARQSAPQQAPPARAGAGSVKVGRNDPCPCGSGQKFKRCCGAAGGPGA